MEDEPLMMEDPLPRGTLSFYRCKRCFGQLTVISRHDGCLPIMISCCVCFNGLMYIQATFEPDDSLLLDNTPTHEFYKPTKREYSKLNTHLKEYVRQGYLLIRLMRPGTLRDHYGVEII